MKNLFVGNMKARVLRALAGVAGMVLLGGVGFAQQVTAPAILVGYPDQIIYNAKIVTMDDVSFNPTTGRIAQAMAVRQGRILALGTDQEMLQLAGPQTRKIDLRGRTVIPGIINTHSHMHDHEHDHKHVHEHAHKGASDVHNHEHKDEHGAHKHEHPGHKAEVHRHEDKKKKI